jgi:hypothetical protein
MYLYNIIKCESVFDYLFVCPSFIHIKTEQRIDVIFSIRIFWELESDIGYFLTDFKKEEVLSSVDFFFMFVKTKYRELEDRRGKNPNCIIVIVIMTM